MSSQAQNSNNQNMSNQNHTPRYANALKKNTQHNIHPHANQGIVLTNIPQLHIEEYLLELSKITNPKKIISISRISNKIYLFLVDKDTTDTIIQNYPYITISNNKIDIRRFTDDTKKIILNNCLITIPNSLIEQKLIELGLQLASKVNLMRISTQYEIFRHIIGPKRQVYIIPNENSTIPESITIEHGNRFHKIYLTDTDKDQNPPQTQTNQPQLIDSTQNNEQTPSQDNYPQIQNTHDLQTNIREFFHNITNTSTPNQKTNTNHEQIINQETPTYNDKPTTSNTIDKQISNHQQTIPKLKLTKQTHDHNHTDTELWASQIEADSKSTSEEEYSDDVDSDDSDKPTHTTKQIPTKRPKTLSSQESLNNEKHEPKQTKRQKADTLDLEKQLKDVHTMIKNNPDKYILTYEELKDLLENAHGNKDKTGLALEYTSETDKLANMLHEIYPLIQDPKTKNRVSRLRKKVLNTTNDDN